MPQLIDIAVPRQGGIACDPSGPRPPITRVDHERPGPDVLSSPRRATAEDPPTTLAVAINQDGTT